MVRTMAGIAVKEVKKEENNAHRTSHGCARTARAVHLEQTMVARLQRRTVTRTQVDLECAPILLSP